MRARKLIIGAVAATAAAGATYAFAIRPWWRSWGVDPAEADLGLPGDDLVADATVVETRGVEIGAPPDAVWPWLVQMGYNRAGWYSYDVVDMKGASVDRIVPELQQLAVGDLVPNSPDTAFVVRVLEPGQLAGALRRRGDWSRSRWRRPARGRPPARPSRRRRPTSRRPGRMMPSMPEFAASWAFVARARSTTAGGRASWSASASGCPPRRARPPA